MSESVSETQVNNNFLNNLGVVKWFNNKSGYGFITIISDGEMNSKDVFVHHSSINVNSEQYKYLVQGEYVSLNVEKSEKGEFVFQTTKVTGVKGGPLMCETRNDIRSQRVERVKEMGEFQESYKRKPRKNNRGFEETQGLQRQEAHGEE